MKNKYIELQKQIKKNLLNSLGRLNRYSYDKNINLINEIINITRFLDKSSSIVERVYCINNFIFLEPRCKICNEKIIFKKYYAETCSIKCNNTLISRNTSEKRSKTLKSKSKNKLYNIIQERFDVMNKNNEYELVNIDVDNEKIKFKCKICSEINIKSFWSLRQYPYCTSKICKVKRMNNNFDDEKFRDYCKQRNLEINGDINYSNREKYKQTCLDKYGETHFMKSKEYKERYKKNNLHKFYIEKIDKIPNIKPLFKKEEYKGISKVHKWECTICGYKFTSSLSSGKVPICRMCNPPLYTSRIEIEIKEWLLEFFDESDLRLNWKTNKHGKKFEIDILIKSKKIGIEVDGIYWHSENSGLKPRNYHKDKNEFFKEHFDYDIIHIWENEWNTKKDLVKSMLKSKLGLIDNKIYARNCDVKELSSTDKNDFLIKNHLQGKDSSSIRLGLYHKNILVSVLTFSKPRFNKNYEYEIVRFCNLIDTIVVGGFSKLFKYFIKNYNPKSIITYADYKFSNGLLYSHNGFKFLHKSNPSYYYTNDYKILENRVKYQKHKLKHILYKFDSNLSEWENMKINGYDRIWDCGNLVFEYKLFT